MKPQKAAGFQSLNEGIGVFNAKEKHLLIPQMNRNVSHLFAGALRSFDIHARVLETCRDLDLGREYTSGKECLPCLITTSDILYFLKKERNRLGEDFNPDNYIYCMPESDGPCRFGMYNKYQRIVLDSFPELRGVKIGSLTSRDGYSLDGMLEGESIWKFRKAAYFGILVGDILNRIAWRIRPYEIEEGLTDQFIERSMRVIADSFEANGSENNFDRILDHVEEIIEEGKTIIDPAIQRKPLVGVVGEIFIRSQNEANQDLVKTLERHGAEVVVASISEWVNYTSYNRMRDARTDLRLNIKQLRPRQVIRNLKSIFDFGKNFYYQQFMQTRSYKRLRSSIDIAEDHKVAHLEKMLDREDVFSFDVGTEACLSISGLIAYAGQGFNGVVNVYPFTCMPGTVTSSIAKPLMNRYRVPYLDTPCDTGLQPGREGTVRTFMYQVYQHFKRNGRKN
ncbi:MAG TPA: CoA activase [Spirochaetes bacterium]|nr:CoA activase [Spirochaetota bacterium]